MVTQMVYGATLQTLAIDGITATSLNAQDVPTTLCFPWAGTYAPPPVSSAHMIRRRSAAVGHVPPSPSPAPTPQGPASGKSAPLAHTPHVASAAKRVLVLTTVGRQVQP